MNFIVKPNLPEKNVKILVVDSRVEADIINEFKRLGIKVIIVKKDNRLNEPVSSHADLHLIHLGKGEFLTSDSFHEDFEKEIKRTHMVCEFFNNRKVVVKGTYPNDVRLNAVMVGKYLICNKRTVADEILLSDRKVLAVSQGYTKCSVAVVSDEAIITDDISIYNATKNYLDVLLINKGSVELNGYNYGFIGGTCGKLSKDILAFSGNIKTHSDAKEIIVFAKNHAVECISLGNAPLYDYGSFIPIIED